MYRLAEHARVRKEDWGLIFYSAANHRILFLRSWDWLLPCHFNGAWTISDVVADIAKRKSLSLDTVESRVQRIAQTLANKGMVVDELR